MKATSIKWILMLGFLALPLLGQEHPLLKKGPQRDMLGSVDSVNAKNGNGFMRIPIGQSYKIGGNFEFQLTLTYNSKIWEDIAGNYTGDPHASIATAFPARTSNAGVGWTLNVGRLTPPRGIGNSSDYWKFTGSDGGDHLFFPTLHQGLPEEAGFSYSRDGSYIRLTDLTGGAHLVEFPDGMSYEFGPDNRLVKIYDALGPEVNYLNVTYSGTTQILKDPKGRTWKLFYEDFILPAGLYPVQYQEDERTIQILNRVEMPGPYSKEVNWWFHYVREPDGSYPELGLGCVGPDLQSTPLPLLEQVVLPDDDPDRAGPLLRYWVDYDLATPQDGCIRGSLRTLTLPTGGTIEWDYVTRVVPVHCAPPPGEEPTPFIWGRSAWVNARRYMDLDGTLLAHWNYSYHFSDRPAKGSDRCLGGGPEEFAPEALISVETNPLGDKIFTAYNIWPKVFESEHGYSALNHGIDVLRPGVTGGADIWNYDGGTPIPVVDPADPAEAGEKRLLSQVYYRKQSGGGFQRYSATYLKYEADRPVLVTGPYIDVDFSSMDRNHRMVSRRIHYFDESGDHGPTTAVTYYRAFDGLGNFREIEEKGFPAIGRNQPGFDPTDESRLFTRTTTKQTNPGTNVFVLDDDLYPPTNWTMPTVSTKWILGNYDRTSTFINGGGKEVREFHFDPHTGQLLQRRIYKNGTASPNRDDHDILEVFTYDPRGFQVEKAVYGGDFQILETDPLPLSELGAWERKTSYTYDETSGALTHQTQHSADNRTLEEFARSVDSNTGLILSSTDTALVETGYQYDQLGRMTELEMPPEAATIFQYQVGESNIGPKITLLRVLSGVVAEKREREMDGFGRNRFQRIWFDDTAGSERISTTEFGYGPNGLLESVSMPYFAAADARWTTFEDYHPTGLPTKVILPDGKEQTLTVTANEIYEFNREVAIDPQLPYSSKISQAAKSGGVSVKSSVWKDFLGRTRIVKERSNQQSSSPVKTTYVYDSGDRLKFVRTKYPDPNVPNLEHTQERRFDFDKRGFLKAETHPEKNGMVAYLGFDTWGNPHQVTDTGIRLANRYDGFGRLVGIFDDLAGRPLEEHFYASQNEGDNRINGKLVLSKRHNYPQGNSQRDVVVSNTYYYNHQQGRPSAMRTRVDDRREGFRTVLNGTVSFEQTFDYDELGRLSQRTLPEINPSWLGADASRRLDVGWHFGNATEVATADGSVNLPLVFITEYGPHGIPQIARFFDTVTLNRTLDDSGTGRPGRIFTEGILAGEDFDSGNYSYDGSGNIEAIGTHRYWYDHVNRLTRAEVSGLADTYRYDRFGNMTSRNGATIPVDPATNRLNDDRVTYDGRGNLIGFRGSTMFYDPLDMVTQVRGDGSVRFFIYGPGNERLVTEDPREDTQRWTVRDENQRVVKSYGRKAAQPLQPDREWVRPLSGGFLSHDLQSDDWQIHITDHLGNVRLVAGQDGQKITGHTYLPFGQELPDGNNLNVAHGHYFSGHERDGETRYYMHRRYYDSDQGRFFSLDPVLGEIAFPQSWNRYAYVLNNPVKYVDPDGNDPEAHLVNTMAGGAAISHGVSSAYSAGHLATGTSVTLHRAEKTYNLARQGKNLQTTLAAREAKRAAARSAVRANAGFASAKFGARLNIYLFIGMEVLIIGNDLIDNWAEKSDAEREAIIAEIQSNAHIYQLAEENPEFGDYLQEKLSQGMDAGAAIRAYWKERINKKAAEKKEKRQQQETSTE